MKKRFYQLSKKVAILSTVAICALLTANQTFAQGVSINATGTGTAPDNSAILDLNITTKGFLVPRMNLVQRNAIASPANSLLIYQTDNTPGFYYNSGTPGVPVWTTFGGGSGPTAGNDIDVTGTQVDVEPVLDFVHTINGAASNPLILNAPFLNDMIFRYNGTEGARLSSAGVFSINNLGGSGVRYVKTDNAGVLSGQTGIPAADLPNLAGDVAGPVTATVIQDNSVDGSDIALGTQANNDLMQYNGTDWVAVAPSSLPLVTSFSAGTTGLTPNTATTGAVTLAGTLIVGNGGTGATTLTGMLKGNGTSAVTGVTGTQWGATYWSDANTIAATAAGTAGNLLMSNGAGAPSWSNNLPAGDGDYIQNQIASAQATSNFWISNIGKIDGSLQLKGSGANYTSITSAATGNYTLTLPVDDGNANQVLATNGTGALSWATPMTNPMDQWGDIIFGSDGSNPSTPDDLSPGTAGLVLHTNGVGANPTWAKVNLAAGPGTEVTGILPVVNGGTGVATIPSNGIMLGAGTSPVTTLVGTNMQTIRNNAGVWTANNNILDDNSTVGIGGLTTAEVTASTAELDIDGDYNLGDLSLQLRSGNSQTSPANAVQIAFGYRGDATYRHNIRTSHNSGGNSNNSLNFYVWNPLTDASTDMGSKKVIEMDYLKLAFWGSLEPNGLPGTAGQVLASGGAGVSPTWVNASTGTVTSIGLTMPTGFSVANSPITSSGTIAVSTTLTGMIKGNGSGFTAVTGTPNFVARWTDANTIGVGLIQDNGTTVGVNQAPVGGYMFAVNGKVKSTGINETSDVRLKTNFNSIDGALAKVLAMNGKYYDWKVKDFPQMNLSNGRQVGVIAQEMEAILPEVVTTGDDGYKAVEYGHIVPVLIEAIKEQQKIIDGQKSTISDLKASLENVLNRINIIEKNVDLNSSKVEK